MKKTLKLAIAMCALVLFPVSGMAMNHDVLYKKNMQFEQKSQQECQDYTSTYTNENPQTNNICQQAIFSKCMAGKMCTTNRPNNPCDLSKTQVRFSCRALEKMGVDCPACENF